MGNVVTIDHVRRQRTDRRINGTIRDEPSKLRIALAGLPFPVGIVKVSAEPVLWKWSPGCAASADELPKLLEPISARKTAGHTDECEWFLQRSGVLS